MLAGKTLIARQIGKMLNSREPKIVNGPEVLNKYVGASEENIRELFKDAEKEQLERGDASDLHVIIFDEIDAICKQRGSVSSGTGVHDTVVNQLLTKIDGVDALNNILLIGTALASAPWCLKHSVSFHHVIVWIAFGMLVLQMLTMLPTCCCA